MSTNKIDLKPLLEDCMGEVDMLVELIDLYKQNILEFIGKAKVHLKNKDYKELQFSAHKLKCGLLLLKTQDLFTIVEQMHSICVKQEDTGQLTYLYDSFLDQYPLTENAIDEQLKKLLKKNQ